jgi:hypothetical protein
VFIWTRQKELSKLFQQFRSVPSPSTAVVAPAIQQKLAALMAEYGSLREEINSRSNSQHLIVQLHITALTVIISACFVTSIGSVILLGIPIETFIFSLWFLEHNFRIHEIGSYIESIENTVNNLLCDEHRGLNTCDESCRSLLGWQSNYKKLSSRKDIKLYNFGRLLYFTFPIPALVALLLILIVLVDTKSIVVTRDKLHMNSILTYVYHSNLLLVVWIIWACELIMTCFILYLTGIKASVEN